MDRRFRAISLGGVPPPRPLVAPGEAHPPRPSLLAVLLAGALAACSASAVRKGAPENVPHVFPHAPHVDNDVACSNCHASIAKATRLDAIVRHVQLPARSSVCADCHETMPKFAVPARYVPFGLTFDHAAHLPRVKADCKVCHRELPEKGHMDYPAPPMAACTGCHEHQKDFEEARCTPCHVDLKSYGLKPVSAFAHRGDWLRAHGQLARPSAQSCAACHEQTYCANCHSAATVPARPEIRWPEQVESSFIHRGDYVSRHTVDVASNPQSCRRCHGSPFCQACHEAQNVAPGVSGTAINPHPSSWLASHAAAARSNIVACAGCHDQGKAANCVLCHASGGVNPHPAGWSSRHGASEEHTRQVCIICHGP